MSQFNRVHNDIVTNFQITNRAFYLYVMLKDLCPNNEKLYAYSKEILDHMLWKSKKTLKKYLKELKCMKIIDYDFDDLPINKPLTITFTYKEEDHYTYVDTDTINNIKNIGQCVLVRWKEKDKDNPSVKIIHEDIMNLKEDCIRLFYLYVHYYNIDMGGAFPAYNTIVEKTSITPRYIKAINDMFNKNHLVTVIVGKRHNDSNVRARNTYIPIYKKIDKKSIAEQ